LWFVSFSITLSSELLVATAIGIPCLCKWRINCSAPEIESVKQQYSLVFIFNS
jgi:hypothetical protein